MKKERYKLLVFDISIQQKVRNPQGASPTRPCSSLFNEYCVLAGCTVLHNITVGAQDSCQEQCDDALLD